MTIVVDSSEINNLREELNEKQAKYETSILPDWADFQIGKLLIQRKEINDFYGSILDKRIWEQAKALAQYRAEDGARPVFVIEGSKFYKDGRRKNIVCEAVKRTLVFSFGIPIWRTKNLESTIDLLVSLDKKFSEGKPFSLQVKPKFKTLEEKRQFLYEAFPEIGATTAKKLVECGFIPYQIFSAFDEESTLDLDLWLTKKQQESIQEVLYS